MAQRCFQTTPLQIQHNPQTGTGPHFGIKKTKAEQCRLLQLRVLKPLTNKKNPCQVHALTDKSSLG